jgi:biotin carboxyl carrier protein
LKLQITIDGQAYEVDVEVLEEDDSGREATANPPQYAMAGAHQIGAWDADERKYRSPVMGLVIKENVTPGQTVEAGDLMMVLEAMKMETNVLSPRAARVKDVCVAQGDSVKVGQVLIELE